MNDLIIQIIQVCVIPLLGVLTKFIVEILSAKRDEIKMRTNNEKVSKYIDLIHDTVSDCVIAVQQSYVDDLKKDGAFTTKAQKEALRRAVDAVQRVLSNDALEYVKETTTDIEEYFVQLIEAEIKKQK